MNTHYVSFRKFLAQRPTIRVQFAIPAISQQEARTIAEKEIAQLRGYRFIGCD